MGLQTYRTKRRFDITPEPRGKTGRCSGKAFVIQKHAARRLHYDLRLELGGVMKSWAVTRGPSLVPNEKRLAVHVEDHPIEYNKFEGTIPQGQYGGGTVMIWDRGRWKPEGDPHKGYREGHLSFHLDGKKLRGLWHLVRMHKKSGEKRENWLLIKAHDEEARGPRDPDILEEEPLSAATGRSMEEIASTQDAVARGNKPVKKNARRPAKAAKARLNPVKTKAAGRHPAKESASKLTHPDRVYWQDVGITKQGLAEYYTRVWKWMAPHVVGRVLALVRCPEGATADCFFQKHASAGVDKNRLHLVAEPDGDESISVDDLDGVISLVQAGVLEIHTRGTTIDHLEEADRLVFDLDPGPGVGWKGVIAAAREVRERLTAVGLKSFLKTSGGKGLHVVLPIRYTPWDEAKDFCRGIAEQMVAGAPDRYTATAKKSARANRIFVDYLRNSREATAVAPYSTRARPGAPVSTPIAWEELGSLPSSDRYTVLNLPQRLSHLHKDPWKDIGRLKQALPAGRR